MFRSRILGVLAAGLGACCAADTALAADEPVAATPHEAMKKIGMTKPMATGMMKQGMTEGDVKRAAETKDREMKPMIKEEEQSMPKDKGQPAP